MFESRSGKTAILASGKVLAGLMSLLITVVLSRWLTKQDYAVYRQTIVVYGIVAPLAALGLHNALYYFLVVEKERSRGVLVENLLLLFIGGSALGLILTVGHTLLAPLCGSPQLAPDLALALLIIAPSALFTLPADAVGSCLLALGRAVPVVIYYVFSQAAVVILTVLFCLVAACSGMALAGRVLAGAVGAVVALMIMFRACSAGDWRPTLGGLHRQLAFSVPLGVATMATILDRSLDKLLVGILAAPEIAAVYYNGAMELPLIGMLVTSVTAVLTADYAGLYAAREYREMIDLFHRALVKSLVFLIPAMFFFFGVAPEFIRWLYTKEYESSALFFRVYLLLIPLSTAGFNAVFIASGRNRHLLIQSALTLSANAVLCWYGIKWFGPIGAAISVIGVQYLIRFPYLTYWVSRILECRWYDVLPWFQLLKIAGASAVGCVLILALKPLVAWPDTVVLGTSAVFYALVTAACFLLFGLTSISALMEVAHSVVKGRF